MPAGNKGCTSEGKPHHVHPASCRDPQMVARQSPERVHGAGLSGPAPLPGVGWGQTEPSGLCSSAPELQHPRSSPALTSAAPGSPEKLPCGNSCTWEKPEFCTIPLGRGLKAAGSPCQRGKGLPGTGSLPRPPRVPTPEPPVQTASAVPGAGPAAPRAPPAPECYQWPRTTAATLA